MYGRQLNRYIIVSRFESITGGYIMKRMLSVLLVMGILLLSVNVVHADYSQWKQYDFVSSSILIYDFDSDGTPEIVTLPYYVLDNYVAIRSPYDQKPNGMLLDFDNDGQLELVLYDDVGNFEVYKGQERIATITLGPGDVIRNIDWNAIAVGNQVIFNGQVYEFNESDAVYPVSAGNKLYVLYTKNGNLYLADTEGNEELIYNDNIQIIGAVIRLGTLYAVGIPELGGTVFIKHDLGGSTEITGFTTTIEKVWGYSSFEEYFIVSTGDSVFKLYQDKILLVYQGEPIYFDGHYLYIYTGGNEIKVYAPTSDRTVDTIYLPYDKKPDVFGAEYPLVAAVYDGKTYALSTLAPVDGYLIAPRNVYAGEKFSYYVSTYNAINATLLFDGQIIPLNGDLTINETGTHTFTLYITNGIVSITKNYTITVKPRPLSISLFSDDRPELYSDFNLTVEVYDGITSRPVYNLECTVETESGTYNITSWIPVNIKLLPHNNNNIIPVKVVCGDDKYYEKTTYEDAIYAEPVPPKIKVEYLGRGIIKVFFLSPDETMNATGNVQIYIDGQYVTQMPPPVLIKNLKPGNHTIKLAYYPNSVLFKQVTYVLNVTYFGNISNVPPQIRQQVYVADVERVINNTIVKNQTVTVTKYINNTIPEPYPVLDRTKAAIMAGIGTIAGIPVGYLLTNIINRNRQSINREVELAEYEPTGDEGEGTVELEEA